MQTPATAYVQGGYSTYAGIWGAYLPLIHALRDRWTYVHVQHYNTGSMYGRDGVLYNPPSVDFHVAMADMLLAGFNVNVYVNNIFFEPLAPEQVAIGLPASTSAAGSGYTEPDVVQTALDYIILGIPFGGQYQLANPAGYTDFRGLMTWSINWDVDNSLEFSNSHRPYLDNLMGVSVLEENVTMNNMSITNYPNPFNPSTVIDYSINSDFPVILEIFNGKGQLLVTKLLDPTTTQWEWYADNYPSGIYFYKLSTSEYSQTRKMVLLK